MTTEQKVQVIAEYDGWKFTNDDPETCPKGYWYIGSGKSLNVGQPDHWEYLTSLDWLHPVAMKVLDELKAIKGELSHSGKVVNACSEPPVNGEYIDLFNAVYDGIEFLNQHK